MPVLMMRIGASRGLEGGGVTRTKVMVAVWGRRRETATLRRLTSYPHFRIASTRDLHKRQMCCTLLTHLFELRAGRRKGRTTRPFEQARRPWRESSWSLCPDRRSETESEDRCEEAGLNKLTNDAGEKRRGDRERERETEREGRSASFEQEPGRCEELTRDAEQNKKWIEKG